MKKSLVALAALAATGAFAQSTVTLYGQADAGYTSVKSGANKFSGITSSNRGSSLFGMRGSEDMGGGLKANFQLEASVNLDNGAGAASNTNNQVPGGPVTVTGASASATTTGSAGDRFSPGGSQGITFNRWSWAGVSGGFGEVRVGREYTPAFINAMVSADPLGTNGIGNALNFLLVLGGSASHPNTSNASNGISYQSPTMAGLTVKVQTYFGENTPPLNTNWVNGKSGDGTSYMLRYEQGPLVVGYGAQETKGTPVLGSTCCNSASSGIPGDYEYSTLYARFQLGMVNLRLQSASEKLQATTATAIQNRKSSTTLVGASVALGGPITLNASYVTGEWKTDGTKSGEASMVALQGMYALSKRTDAYVIYASTDNKVGNTYGFGTSSKTVGVAAAGATSSGFSVGLRHSF